MRTCFCAIVVHRAVLNSVVIIESLVLVDISRPVIFGFTGVVGGESCLCSLLALGRRSVLCVE